MALIAAGVALGLTTVGGTYALWHAMVPAGAGSIRSADFLITLTGSNNTGTHNMVLADGTPATVSLTSAAAPLADLFPGTAVYAGVSVTNATAAGSSFTVLASLPGPAAITDTVVGSSLSQYLSVQSATATALTECSAVPASAYQDTFPGVSIPKNGSAVICFKIQLTTNAPSTLQGQSIAIAIPLHVQQV